MDTLITQGGNVTLLQSRQACHVHLPARLYTDSAGPAIVDEFCLLLVHLSIKQEAGPALLFNAQLYQKHAKLVYTSACSF